MTETPNVRRSFWRFSLRELLLVMLAAAAFMGWGTLLYRSQRLKPSPFFSENKSWEQDVAAIFQELDEPPFTLRSSTTMSSDGALAVQRTISFRIPLAAEKRGAFLSALQKRVREKLLKAGYGSTGEARGSGTNEVAILGYHNGAFSGTVQICVGPTDNNRLIVILTMVEQQGRGSSDFGIEIVGE